MKPSRVMLVRGLETRALTSQHHQYPSFLTVPQTAGRCEMYLHTASDQILEVGRAGNTTPYCNTGGGRGWEHYPILQVIKHSRWEGLGKRLLHTASDQTLDVGGAGNWISTHR